AGRRAVRAGGAGGGERAAAPRRAECAAPPAPRATPGVATGARLSLASLAPRGGVAAMEAVVMAAGEGRRLRPLTERWAKPVLPVDGRPVIGTLLRELADGGVERAFVVTGHLAEQVEALVGDGSAFGLDVSFVRQAEPLGSADAMLRAVRAGAQPPLVVTAADTVFARGDLRRFVAETE